MVRFLGKVFFICVLLSLTYMNSFTQTNDKEINESLSNNINDDSNKEIFFNQIQAIYSNQRSAIEAEYNSSKFTIENPYIKLNPFKNAPLSAIIKFDTPDVTKVSIKIHGISPAEDIVHTFKKYTKKHELPIVGLYPGYKNQLEIISESEDKFQTKNLITIETPKINSHFTYLPLIKTDANNNYYSSIDEDMHVYDEFGYIRFYFHLDNETANIMDMSGVQSYWLDNKIVIENAKLGLLIFSKTGELKKFLYFPKNFQSSKKCVTHTSSGNYLVIGTFIDKTAIINKQKRYTCNDVIIELDKKTSKVVKIFDCGELLNPSRNLYNEEISDDLSVSVDWLKLNFVEYDGSDNSILACSKNFGFFKIDYNSGKIKWIATPNIDLDKSGRNNNNGSLKAYALKAMNNLKQDFTFVIQDGSKISENFHWPICAQHATKNNNIYVVFSNNGAINNKNIATLSESDILLYKIDEENKKILLYKQIKLPEFSDNHSNAFFDAAMQQITIFSAFLSNKNTNNYESKIYRIDLKGNKNFQSILVNQNNCHNKLLPITFYKKDLNEKIDIKVAVEKPIFSAKKNVIQDHKKKTKVKSQNKNMKKSKKRQKKKGKAKPIAISENG